MIWMKFTKIIFLLLTLFLIYGCTSSKDKHISSVEIKFKETSINHTFIIEINPLDQPQHLDYIAMENANLFHTNKNQEATIIFERNIRYNIKIYKTSSNNYSDIKEGNYKPYMNNVIYENEHSFNDEMDVLIIE